MNLLVTCKCGHQMIVSEYAAGMTAPCPKCGQPLTVSPDNAKPITRDPTSAPSRPASAQGQNPISSEPEIHYTPLQTTSLKNNCARCGREFRGDWDRHQSSMGLVCNICKNLVQQNQNLQSTGYVAPVDSMKLDPVLDPQPQQPVEVEEVEKSWREKYWPDEAMMRRIAIGGAVAFGLYTVYLVISGAWVVEPAPEDLENTVAVAESAPLPELPMWAAVMMTALSTASTFISTLAGIYIFLMIGRRLPDTNVFANLIQILPAAAVITLLYFAASVLPFAGIAVTLIFVPAIIFIAFGFEAQDIINFPLAMVLAGILKSMTYLLIHGAIAAIAL